MHIVIAEKMDCVIGDGVVSLVWEVSMDTFIEPMPVIIIWSCVCRFIQVLRRVWIIFTVIWKWPELCPPSCSSHHLQHLSLLHISLHSHLLLVHVYFQAINTCIIQNQFYQIELNRALLLKLARLSSARQFEPGLDQSKDTGRAGPGGS